MGKGFKWYILQLKKKIFWNHYWFNTIPDNSFNDCWPNPRSWTKEFNCNCDILLTKVEKRSAILKTDFEQGLKDFLYNLHITLELNYPKHLNLDNGIDTMLIMWKLFYFPKKVFFSILVFLDSADCLSSINQHTGPYSTKYPFQIYATQLSENHLDLL